MMSSNLGESGRMVPYNNIHLSRSGADVADNDCQRPDGGTGSLGNQCGEIPGIFLCQRQHDQVTVIRLASKRAQHPCQPLPIVRARPKRRKVSDGDMPAWRNVVENVGGVGVLAMHRDGGIIL